MGDRGFEEERFDRMEEDLEGRGRSAFKRRRACRFCTEEDAKIDYRDGGALKFFISERGKIVPRRISGNCSLHQRELSMAVKRERALALLPFNATGA